MPVTKRVLILALLAFGTGATAQENPAPPEPIARSLDARFEELVPKGMKLEKIVDGHEWVEGPVWMPDGGYLLFSDVPRNAIYRWKEGEGEAVFLRRSGYSGWWPSRARGRGSNGLTLDREGRLVLTRQGNREIARREKDGRITVLVQRYQGKRLNSPNDLVYHSSGDLYFTDPPFGLAKRSAKELPHQGVYRLDRTGELTLVIDDLSAPNGIAFSPDERTLYVSNSDPRRMVWMAYDVDAAGRVDRGRVLFDGTRTLAGRPGAPDGLKVDAQGNIFAAGPGGVYVFTAKGTLLGWFDLADYVGNVAWGEDGATLFIAANAAVYRVRLATWGAGWR
jgi:gluconolactonase